MMELVKGIPLTEYCDAHQLGLPDRLQIFRQICSPCSTRTRRGSSTAT